MSFKEYPSREALMAGLGQTIAGELRAALSKGAATLSVPGGTTPGPIFDALAQEDLDWPRVAVMLNDERWVGEESSRSNTRLLKERLLVAKAARARLVPLYAPTETPEESLDKLAEGIIPHLPITSLLLGMGADMHTASLFPGADKLAQALAGNAPVLMALRAEAAGEPRITLTAPVLKQARHIHILITGPEKLDAYQRALTLSPTEAPVAAVLPQATVHWAA
ncbi:6-phosphogluconolactonase [Stagnihabitans tardus]|uniref:6-phosphogluconolactonase n=1 Tax=Stagnihabitans tardus TaxID=2699202 RepID=A0AAE5BR12_9RHOB|nr:6-phosphogluconolactonase [Stagnihabitans tardus]NBZ86015.1 6-phosphogluconolactonase [Stagnihabitans tardus]